MQKILGGDKFLGRDSQCFSRADQIGFVVGEEFDSRSKDHRITQPTSQRIGIEPGQFKVARRAILAFDHPAQRGQRERLRTYRLRFGAMRDCPVLLLRVTNRRGRNVGSSVTKRIMVVEDNDLNRKLFCDVLRANGFEVEPVADGDQVLATARATSPDLIIMDIQLGGISGVDLIEAAKRDGRLSGIPVLAVTAFAAKGDEERIRAAGAEGYLSKPVSIGPFMNAVNALV